MHELDEANAEAYLRAGGYIEPGEVVRVEVLPGGVSNQVLYVSFPERNRDDFVLKQARKRLRVSEPWFSRLERVWREVEVLHICRRLLEDPATAPEGGAALRAQTPGVLFEDRVNYAFAMTAAPKAHEVWKAQLLAGQAEVGIAEQCGLLLGRLHAGTWHDPEVARRLDDRQVFDELRIDPYYRKIAQVHPTLAAAVDRLESSVWENRHALVHADFSPKNLLVYEGGLMMVDFECGHYGDPAFDVGFFLSHLVLKTFQFAPRAEDYLKLVAGFQAAYERALRPAAGDAAFAGVLSRGLQNFAGCALARLDGKSPIDYLEDEPRRDAVRTLCRDLLEGRIDDWQQATEAIRQRVNA